MESSGISGGYRKKYSLTKYVQSVSFIFLLRLKKAVWGYNQLNKEFKFKSSIMAQQNPVKKLNYPKYLNRFTRYVKLRLIYIKL